MLDAEGESRLVTVRLGLAAAGFVEVEGIDGSLEVGDRVVIGIAAQQAPSEPEDDADVDEEEPAEPEGAEAEG